MRWQLPQQRLVLPVLVLLGCVVHGVCSDVNACTIALQAAAEDLALVSVLNQATATVSTAAAQALGYGYAADISNYDECMRIAGVHHCLAGSVKLNAGVLAPSPPLSGLCAPKKCHEAELEDPDTLAFIRSTIVLTLQNITLLRTAAGQQQLQYFAKLNDTLTSTQFSSTGFTCGNNSASMTLGRYLCYSLVWVLVGLVVVATLYDMASGNTPPTAEDDADADRSCTAGLVKTFSLLRNIGFVVEPRRDGSFACLDGLRAISILWIVLGHTLAVQASVGYLNPADVLPPTGFLRNVSAQIYFSSRFAVDTFFVVSGFLTMHKLCERLDPPHFESIGASARRRTPVGPSASSHSWFRLFFLHRVFRILPLYLFCLLVWWQLGVLMGEGPYWYRWFSYVKSCDSYWWTNLLFINNLIPYSTAETEECLYPSWYLANDMQFYAITPVFLLLYLRNRKYGWIAVATVLLASCSLSLGCTIVYNWSAHTFDGVWVGGYSRGYYTKPQFRIPPYLMGILGALLWHQKLRQYRGFKFSQLYAVAVNVLACALIATLVFIGVSAYQQRPCDYTEEPDGTCGSNWSIASRAAYNALTKPLWGAAVTVLILMCLNKQGGAIDKFLGHRLWTLPAKLSFAAYLLHPLIINVWFLGRTQKVRWSEFDFAMTIVAVIVVTFVCALFAMVVVESPCQRLLSSVESRDGRQPENGQGGAAASAQTRWPTSDTGQALPRQFQFASYGATQPSEATALLSQQQGRSQAHEFRGKPRRIGET